MRKKGREPGIGEVFEVLRAANGSPTALFRFRRGPGVLLHSQVDPEDEARFLVRNVRPADRTLYVVLGFGMGYHVREILQRIPRTSCVAVVEPSGFMLSRAALKVLQKAGRNWFRDPRLVLQNHHDPDTAPLFLADTFSRHRMLGLQLYTHIPTAQTNEPFYRRLLSVIPQRFPAALEAHLSQYEGMLENDLTNFWANLGASWESAHVSTLSGCLEGRPALVVGAGPSLTEDLDGLREAKGRAFIVCVATAAPILMQHGVVPDLVVSIDPNAANRAHFEGWDTTAAPLVYYHRIWREIPSRYGGSRFWFTMEDEPPLPHGGQEYRAPFWRGGSVIFTALQLSHYLKARAVALVGVDLAFPGGKTHAAGAAHARTLSESELREGFFRVPAAFGGEVFTSGNFHAFLRYLEDFICRNPQVPHFNTAQGGARIAGAQEMTLARFLDRFGTGNGTAVGGLPEAGARKDPKGLWQRRRASVERWVEEGRRYLARFKGEETPQEAVSAFRRLSLYRQAEQGYEDCFYFWEIRSRGGRGGPWGEGPARLRSHVQGILEHLDALRQRLQKRGS